jgi:hypothetical protein
MIVATLDGADIDAQFRARGAVTLVDLRGTKMMCYRFGSKSPHKRVQIFRPGHNTPLLTLFMRFLVSEARVKK